MPDEEIDWLECVPWTGEERDLPLGEQTKIPDFRAVDLVKAWEVLDVQSELGFKVVPTKALSASDKIIGAQINENSVKAIKRSYGDRWFVAKRADGRGPFTREEWYTNFGGADVLELEALKQIRQKRR
jgi:hypothetical protein